TTCLSPTSRSSCTCGTSTARTTPWLILPSRLRQRRPDIRALLRRIEGRSRRRVHAAASNPSYGKTRRCRGGLENRMIAATRNRVGLSVAVAVGLFPVLFAPAGEPPSDAKLQYLTGKVVPLTGLLAKSNVR